MCKRIGIITLYYKSNNYGGNLQAYALCRCICKLSYSVEQICYPWVKDREENDYINFPVENNPNCMKRLKMAISKVWRKISNESYHLKYYKQIGSISKEKEKKLLLFNQKLIPHSKNIFTTKNLHETLTKYDAFITGSDQVWNTAWYTPAFFLDFVPSHIIKLSYAASISKDSLTDEEKEIFRKSLADFRAISVREDEGIKLIKSLTNVEPCVTLDPTLLLDKSDWDEICTTRLVKDNYIFCYFLGDNKNERKIAQKYAQQKKLKVVSIPLAGTMIYSDLNFGDIIFPSASPQEFISLIKYASYVFTDSFHAVVFSQIYERQYFVFNRNTNGNMNSRIINITNLFNTQDRFCNGRDRENIEYIQSLSNIDYLCTNRQFEEKKKESINFLRTNLS